MIRAVLRTLGIVVIVHGVLLAAAASLVSMRGSTGLAAADAVYVFVLVVPALLLAAPLMPLLWRLGLMNAPGWFAWPKPLGLALVYVIWSLAALGASYAIPGPTREKRLRP